MRNILILSASLFISIGFTACNLEEINDVTKPVAAFTIDKNSCDAPCTITLVNNSTGEGLTYLWSFDNGETSTLETPAPISYTTAKLYNIRLIVTNNGNLRDTAEATVSIIEPGVTPAASFTIINNGCTAPCTINFTNTTVNGETFQWDFGDPESGTNNTSTDISPSHEYAMPGAYSVTLTATNGSKTHSISQVVTINGIKFEKSLASWGPGAKARQLSDGGYIIAGTLNNDIYLLRTNAEGEITNQRTYNDSNADLAKDVIQLSDGTFAVVGTTFNAGTGNTDCLYLRVNSSLNPINGPVRIGENDGDEEALSIVELTDGSMLITGYSTVTSSGNTDVYVARYNPSLTTEFFKKRITAPDNEVGFDAVPLSTGFMIVGEINIPGSAAASNALLLKIDNNGNKISGFPKSIGGAGYESVSSAVLVNSSEIMLCGFTTSSGAGEGDIYLQRVNTDGSTIGSVIAIGTASNELGYEIGLTASGGFCIGGQSGLDAYLVTTDGAGTPVINKTFVASGEEAFSSVQQTSDGGYVLCGYKNSALYFVKTDKNGKTN